MVILDTLIFQVIKYHCFVQLHLASVCTSSKILWYRLWLSMYPEHKNYLVTFFIVDISSSLLSESDVSDPPFFQLCCFVNSVSHSCLDDFIMIGRCVYISSTLQPAMSHPDTQGHLHYLDETQRDVRKWQHLTPRE